MVELIAYKVEYDRTRLPPWFEGMTAPFDSMKAETEFESFEAHHKEEVEKAVRLLLSAGKSQVLSPDALYLLGLRVDVCIDFVTALASEDDFIPVPAAAKERIVEWLLIDWWKHFGPRHALALSCLQI